MQAVSLHLKSWTTLSASFIGILFYSSLAASGTGGGSRPESEESCVPYPTYTGTISTPSLLPRARLFDPSAAKITRPRRSHLFFFARQATQLTRFSSSGVRGIIPAEFPAVPTKANERARKSQARHTSTIA